MNPGAPPAAQPPTGSGVPYPHLHARPANAPAPARYSGPLACPVCHATTTDLKKFTFLAYLVFIGIFGFWSVKRLVACPGCMRKELLLRTAMNTVLANLLWPIVILPWNGVLFLMTFSRGHSATVRPLGEP